LIRSAILSKQLQQAVDKIIAMKTPYNHLPIIRHAGFLDELQGIPGYLNPTGYQEYGSHFSWPFYSGGISGKIDVVESLTTSIVEDMLPGPYILRCYYFGQLIERNAVLKPNGTLEVSTPGPIASAQSVFLAELEHADLHFTVMLRETSQGFDSKQTHPQQSFLIYRSMTRKVERVIQDKMPEEGFAKLRVSMGEQAPIFPIQLSSSVLDVTGRRVGLFYQDAIERLADLLLSHRSEMGRVLVYAGGDLDYFDQFALHEVCRLLGIRNLSGSSEFSLRAAARTLAFQAGEESPILSLDQALDGPNRLYLISGWNGLVSHLPVFNRMVLREDLDAWLIDTCVTESAKIIAARLSPERVLLVKTGGDTQLALAVTHEILTQYPAALDQAFISAYCDSESLEQYLTLARSERFQVERIAEAISPDPAYTDRLVAGIRTIASQLVKSEMIPVHLAGSGLSQTSGLAGHGLWNNLFALLGKFGLNQAGEARGGSLRLPYQPNEATQVQGLAQDRFFGNIEINQAGCKEAALRMGLPFDAYQRLINQAIVPVLEYAQPSAAGQRDMIICIGQGLEGQMIDRARLKAKLSASDTTLVVIDPTPGPFFLRHAALCIPILPEVSGSQLYQNGEWRLTLSFPRRAAPNETRSAATLLYDTMAEISRNLREDTDTQMDHPDLAKLSETGYLQQRFEPPEWSWGGQLERIDGEVSRFQLWERIQAYLTGTSETRGPLYCRPEHNPNQPITWEEILSSGSLIYGGVGTTRHRQGDPENPPFQNIYREKVSFRFFVPQDADLSLPTGIVLNSGSSTLSDNIANIRYAISSFHSNKVLDSLDMPKNQRLFISLALAETYQLALGQNVKVTNTETGRSLILEVEPTSRLKGQMAYLCYHHSLAEIHSDSYLNILSYRTARCAYSGLPFLKSTQITLEAVAQGVV
jgi:hypothetical protein